MSKIYDGPGKARKECPGCKKYIHARSNLCPGCEYEFKAGAKASIEAKTNIVTNEDAGAGRGRKQCPGCMKYVGVRTQICKCGNDFIETGAVVKEKERSPERIEAEELMPAIGYFDLPILYVPAGECSVKLKGHDKDTVFKWCEDVLSHYLGEGKFASPVCMRYLVGKFVQPSTPEHKKAIEYVNLWKEEYINNYEPIGTIDWEAVGELV